MYGEDEKSKVSWILIKRVLAYARPYIWGILLVLLCILATTGLALVTPLIFRDLIDTALPNKDYVRLNWLAVALVMIPLVSSGIRIVQRKINAVIGTGVIMDLRMKVYGHLQRMSLRFFTYTKTGELMSRLNNDVIGAQTAVSDTIVDIVTNTITVVATVSVMIALEWRLTLIGLAIIPLFAFLGKKLGKKLRDVARKSLESRARLNAMMNETLNISGLLLVKLFGQRQDEVGRFKERASEVREIGVRQAVIGSQFFVLVGLVSVIGTALVYLVGGHFVIRGFFTIGTIVAFSSYLTQLYGPLRALTNAPVAFAQSMVSFERVFEVVDLPVEIADKPNAAVLSDVRGRLEFKGISFSYGTGRTRFLTDVKRVSRMYADRTAFSGTTAAKGRPGGRGSQARELALDDISFTVEPGQLAALVGPSGAGKTTVTYLLPRLYDPTGGAILLDGRDLRDVTLSSLVAQIGVVTQETYLFHDTIRVNLAYAKPDATEGEIEAACRAAHIHDFISELPDGYETVVGERGYRLSGGEKQRLAMARVILKDPRILILDEATSHLDSHSENLIQDALKRVMKERTSLVIAHRLSTILAADLILVMDKGKIVERGTHEDLVSQQGLYARLVETQFGAVEKNWFDAGLRD
jgi:ATP-binding cassette subfamily B protein